MRHNLANALPIPDNHIDDSPNDLSNDEQLALYAQTIRNNTNESFQTPTRQDIRSPNSQQVNSRRSTNSLSSISHATQAIVGTNISLHGSSISKVINICNNIDTAEDCIATDELVKKCIRNVIWTSNKFLSDLSIKATKIENHDNPKSVLNILINFTRKSELNDLDRLRFWKKYSGIVQQDLNNIKTICTRSIKEEIISGKCLFS